MGLNTNAYIIGIDESTNETKAVLIDEQGNQIASGAAAYSTIAPKHGYVEQDAKDWWRALKKSIGSMLKSANVSKQSIIGLSITHQRYTFVPVNRRIEPIRNAILWNDTRCGAQAEWAKNKFGAAICAAVGVGLYNSIREAIRNMVTISRTFQCNQKENKIYNDIYFDIYKPFYSRVYDLMNRLSKITKYP